MGAGWVCCLCVCVCVCLCIYANGYMYPLPNCCQSAYCVSLLQSRHNHIALRCVPCDSDRIDEALERFFSRIFFLRGAAPNTCMT